MPRTSFGIALALMAAMAEAAQARHEFILPDHLVCGLTKLEDLLDARTLQMLGLPAAQAPVVQAEVTQLLELLQAFQIKPRDLRHTLRAALGDGGYDRPKGEPIHRSPESRQCFERAAAIAQEAKAPLLATQHLLAALLELENTLTRQLLTKQGVDIAALVAAARARSVVQTPPGKMDLTLRYRRKDGVEKQKHFPSEQEIIIGRPKSIPIQIDLSPDLKVSRPHARLFHRLSAWWVEDLHSAHGTYLNGVRIAEAVTLAPGDELRLGDTTLRVHFTSFETLLPEGVYEATLAVDEVEPPATIPEDLRLALLDRFSKIALRQTHPQGLLDRFVEELGVLFPQADHKVILLEENRDLTPLSAEPRSAAHVSFTLVREAMRSRRALHWVRRLAGEGEPVASLHDTVAALCTPILYNGRPIGAVYLDATRLDSMFTAADLVLLSEIANLLAQPLKTIDSSELSRFPRVFLSYAAADRAFVDRLVSDLRRRRIKVWFDERLQPGRARLPQIDEAIHATEIFLLLLSPAGVVEPQALEELDIALRKGKPILPLLYQPCNPPRTIVGLVPVDFTNQEYAAAIDALEQAVYDLLKPVSKESTMRILFLAANPIDTAPLRLSAEVRTIDERLRLAEFRDRFELIQHWAVRAGDLSEFLLRHQPHIVHFAGHGSDAGEIMLEDELGQAKALPPAALAQLFRILKDNVRLVVLNACLSLPQARAIAKEIDCVVGMTREISDEAAIKFAGGFYRGLGYGRSVKAAFDLGCNEIDLPNLDEETRPRLLTKSGVKASNVVFV